MNPRKIRTILLIIAVLVFSASLVIDSYAGQDAVALRDGDDVVQTNDGQLYVGEGLNFADSWVHLYNVRYPDEGVGAVSFPIGRVKMIYHKGPLPTSK